LGHHNKIIPITQVTSLFRVLECWHLLLGEASLTDVGRTRAAQGETAIPFPWNRTRGRLPRSARERRLWRQFMAGLGSAAL
jgi:hypothetical protein